MIDDGVARIAQSQAIVTGAIKARADAQVLQDPILSEIRRGAHQLVLEGRFVGDEATHRDPARRALASDGDIAIAQMNAGIDQTADLEEDGFGPGLINRPLQRAHP